MIIFQDFIKLEKGTRRSSSLEDIVNITCILDKGLLQESPMTKTQQ